MSELDDKAIANRRILRLSVGVSLSLLFSQFLGWQMSYISPIFTLLLLSLPMPKLSLAAGFKLVLVLSIAIYLSALLLIPLLEYARMAGVLLVILALFGSFYYSARGGSMIVGLFMLIGITIVITIGTVSLDALLALMPLLIMGALSGVSFVWLAHTLLPDLNYDRQAPPKPQTPSLSTARKNALRSLIVVLPMTIFVLFSGSSAAYVPLMLKVSSMGQQANSDLSRKMGYSQIESTVWGGIAAIIAWQLMSIYPSLLLYGLITALAALIFGKRIFAGKGQHPKATMWSYAFLTMIVLLAPALLDGQTANGANAAFYSRLILFIAIAIYGTVAVIVFDAFSKRSKDSDEN